MKFMFVVGGSYKSFYLNKLPSINKIDLLIFHQDIFYEYDYVKEDLGKGIVNRELIALNNKLKCPIVACVKIIKNNIETKGFILCINKKIFIIDYSKDLYLYIKNKFILIGNKLYKRSSAFATISILEERLDDAQIDKSKLKNYILCDKKGVSCLKNGKICRKFQKCCYFSLSFYKKML